jgi:hypothetical protein
MRTLKSKDKIETVRKLNKVREQLKKLTAEEKILKDQVYTNANGETAYQAGEYLVSIDWSKPRLVWDNQKLINYLKEDADRYKKETKGFHKLSIRELQKKAA